MPYMELTTAQRSDLRARAHSLHPVVSVSQQGLSETVLAEIDRSLKAHELIKVRVYGEERTTRAALMSDICTRLDAAPVQHIGNLLVIFRANPEEKKTAPSTKATLGAKVKTKPKTGTKTGTKAGVKARAKPSPAKATKFVRVARPTDPRRRGRA